MSIVCRVAHVESHFSFLAPPTADRLLKRELGGGALLDIGVYPLSFINVSRRASLHG